MGGALEFVKIASNPYLPSLIYSKQNVRFGFLSTYESELLYIMEGLPIMHTYFITPLFSNLDNCVMGEGVISFAS